MNKKSVVEVLSRISEGGAIAENESVRLKDFLQLKEYKNLGISSRFLVLGGRGSGKTCIFRTMVEEGFRYVVGEEKIFNEPNYENTVCLAGYCQTDIKFPSGTLMDRYANDKDAMAFWSGCLVIQIISHSSTHAEWVEKAKAYLGSETTDLLMKENAAKNVSEWLGFFKENAEKWENLLDYFDGSLMEEGRWLLVAYDQLDRVCTEYNHLFPFIRSLLSFWFNHLHRWKRLKSKIFLRTDLFDADALRFPDSSKLKANMVNLVWKGDSLYRLLIKRLANTTEVEYQKDVEEYLKTIPDLLLPKDEVLGWIPTEKRQAFEQFVEESIGKYMGGNPKKGLAYPWILNHLQDANGDLSPRSFLKCYAQAAKTMLEQPNGIQALQANRILSPPSIQNAVIAVSEDRVAELQEEYPWLSKLKKSLQGKQLKMKKEEFLFCIQIERWLEDKIWMGEEGASLPSQTTDEIYNFLEILGIIQESKGEVNMPEIYLHGFGMKRKGGLSRIRKE